MQLLSGSEIMSDKLDLKKHIRNVDDFPIPGSKLILNQGYNIKALVSY